MREEWEMTMVERVSKAIQDKMPGWLAEDSTIDDAALAIAAISAMREPTPNMCAAFSDPIDPWGPAPGYRAMIDAALAEGCDNAAAAHSSSETDHV